MTDKYARQLRKQMTPQEVKLWVKLRELKQLGFHFRRQAPIGRYIVDFVCFKREIVIEVDGGQYGMIDGMESAAARDSFLASEGFHVMRFWNSEIDQNLSGVLEVIFAGLKAATPPGKSRATLPTRGRDKDERQGRGLTPA